MHALNVGDSAPGATLHLHTGETIPLADLYRDHVVVLFFYPKNGTAICTKEACAFRDSYEQFTTVGATVVGVSSDSAESHQQFADQHRLPFLLAADPDGALRKAFGVPKTLGLLPGRVTYVIDRQGIIRAIFSAQFAAHRHVHAALDAIKGLSRVFQVAATFFLEFFKCINRESRELRESATAVDQHRISFASIRVIRGFSEFSETKKC